MSENHEKHNMRRIRNILGWSSFVVALNFPVYANAEGVVPLEELVKTNVGLVVKKFSYTGGMQRNSNGKLTCNGTEVTIHQVVGSGFLVKPDGTIMTNFHVANRAQEAIAIFDSGARYDVRHIKAYNQVNDLATLVIKANQRFPTVELGDSDNAKPLDGVISVGNPRGLGLNVTEGKVSQVVRDDYDRPKIIRHTAPIMGGSSGGALYHGKSVIGINVSTFTGSQFHQAVPVNIAKNLLTSEFDNAVPLHGAFPSNISTIVKRIKPVDSVSGTVNADSTARAVFNLEPLTDYVLFAKTNANVDIDLVIKNSKGKVLGCGFSNKINTEVLVRTNEYARQVSIEIINRGGRNAPVKLSLGRIKW